MRLVGADAAVPLFLLQIVGGVPTEVADLDPGLLHPLVDVSDEVLPALLGQRRDVQPDDRTLDVGGETQVALLDRLLDRAEDGAIPGLDDDLVRLGDADPRELVERSLRAVVVDLHPFDEGGRSAARPDSLEVALHRVDRAAHLVIGVGDRLAAHRAPPAPPDPPEIRVPTSSPAATRVMLSGWFRSNTMIGRSFSIQSETAAASMTLSWSRRRSAYSSEAYRRALGLVIGSASYTPSTLVALSRTSAPISTARSAAAVSVVKYGLLVPATKIATRPFSRCRTARGRM